MGLRDRLQHAYNAFRSGGSDRFLDVGQFGGFSDRPDRMYRINVSDKTVINSIITKISIDVASVKINHVRLDQNGRFNSVIKSGLNDCLTLSANIDQTGRALIQDAAFSLCDEGVIAIVPVDTSIDPELGSYSIDSLRVGRILEWYPKHVRVDLYNEEKGIKEEIVVPKASTAIIENPLYSIMNEPNSMLKRLTRKLNLMDSVDEQIASDKLDLIIQLPYVVKTPIKRREAEARKKEIEMQLIGSKHGIVYIDGTERITQLNRPVENNILKQVEYLTNTVYSQLGFTQGIFDGTADERTILNYQNRTVEPIVSAIVDELNRKFLTKTARTQGQAIMFFMDSFKLVPVSQLAEIADKFTRNEILSSNEVRSIIGYKPVDDPRADELRNKNLNQNADENSQEPVTTREEASDDRKRTNRNE